MAHRTQLHRRDAAAYAREQGWAGFRTRATPDGMWKATYEPGDNLGQPFADAHPDLCSHGETTWHQGATGSDDADKVGVLVLTCDLEAIGTLGAVAMDRAVAQVWFHPTDRTWGRTFLVEPHDRERWDVFTPKVQGKHDPREQYSPIGKGKPLWAIAQGAERAAEEEGNAPRPVAAPKERSTADSPVKRVWAIADSMPDASRADIIKVCVDAGINKSTAGTQYYHWSKAKKGP